MNKWNVSQTMHTRRYGTNLRAEVHQRGPDQDLFTAEVNLYDTDSRGGVRATVTLSASYATLEEAQQFCDDAADSLESKGPQFMATLLNAPPDLQEWDMDNEWTVNGTEGWRCKYSDLVWAEVRPIKRRGCSDTWWGAVRDDRDGVLTNSMSFSADSFEEVKFLSDRIAKRMLYRLAESAERHTKGESA